MKLGRIEAALSGPFMKSATVRESCLLEGQFHLVTLSGESLRGTRWTPGEKVQVALGGWAYRTYTPMSWDSDVGSMQLLLYLHGVAKGAVWARSLRVGDSCTLFGPRASLDFHELELPSLVFGDETSFALAHAARLNRRRASDVPLVFEVTSKKIAENVLGHLQIAGVDLIERTSDESHLSEIEKVVLDHLQAGTVKSCALSGKASSIQRLNKRLRSLGLSSRQIRTRAYWAPGKEGLD